ncbi:MAG: sulfotransferase domain-containing protein [Candidatus Thermoplasmatota archaeon]|nr:sulfotransferase domain-containing protein [Candidatus Thermoplasmatota archaeon]
MKVKLDENINYIVSGLERSGTSMMMQILHAVDIPIASDDLRKSDENNPKGYYELEGGKIINRLMEKTFPIEEYEGRFIKITAFGLSFLPQGSYKIIYMERNLDEVMDSMEKMAKINDETREETKESFKKLNEKIKNDIKYRDDIDVLFVNYNEMLEIPKENVKRVCNFLNLYDAAVNAMVGVIDTRLYRQRR